MSLREKFVFKVLHIHGVLYQLSSVLTYSLVLGSDIFLVFYSFVLFHGKKLK